MLLHSSDTCNMAIFNSIPQYRWNKLKWELHITFPSTLDAVFLFFAFVWSAHVAISLLPSRLDIDRAIKFSGIEHVWGWETKSCFFSRWNLLTQRWTLCLRYFRVSLCLGVAVVTSIKCSATLKFLRRLFAGYVHDRTWLSCLDRLLKSTSHRPPCPHLGRMRSEVSGLVALSWVPSFHYINLESN